MPMTANMPFLFSLDKIHFRFISCQAHHKCLLPNNAYETEAPINYLQIANLDINGLYEEKIPMRRYQIPCEYKYPLRYVQTEWHTLCNMLSFRNIYIYIYSCTIKYFLGLNMHRLHLKIFFIAFLCFLRIKVQTQLTWVLTLSSQQYNFDRA